MFYIRNRCGAWQAGGDATNGALEFRLFFPKNFDPEIAEIRGAGDFQRNLGGTDWDFPGGMPMTRRDTADGTFYETTTPQVPAGFYAHRHRSVRSLRRE